MEKTQLSQEAEYALIDMVELELDLYSISSQPGAPWMLMSAGMVRTLPRKPRKSPVAESVRAELHEAGFVEPAGVSARNGARYRLTEAGIRYGKACLAAGG